MIRYACCHLSTVLVLSTLTLCAVKAGRLETTFGWLSCHHLLRFHRWEGGRGSEGGREVDINFFDTPFFDRGECWLNFSWEQVGDLSADSRHFAHHLLQHYRQWAHQGWCFEIPVMTWFSESWKWFSLTSNHSHFVMIYKQLIPISDTILLAYLGCFYCCCFLNWKLTHIPLIIIVVSARLYLTLCDSVDYQFSSVQLLSRVQPFMTPWTTAHHASLSITNSKFTQTHVHWVSDAIQPSHPLSFPSRPAFNLSQHQGLSQWVSSSHRMAKILEFQLQHQSFQWTFRTDFLQEELVGSPCSPRDSQESHGL